MQNRRDLPRSSSPPSTSARTATPSTTRRSATYGPNLTHLAAVDFFASATFPLNKKNLVEWVMNAPSMIPMQTEDPKCRPSAVLGCVGMPSFIENVPQGEPKMSQADAEQIADFLLEQK